MKGIMARWLGWFGPDSPHPQDATDPMKNLRIGPADDSGREQLSPLQPPDVVALTCRQRAGFRLIRGFGLLNDEDK